MRIIGGRDYFDSALAYGRDETLVFARKRHDSADVMPFESSGLVQEADQVSFANGEKKRWDEEFFTVGSKEFTCTPAAAWFAGKRYGGIEVRPRDRNGWKSEHHAWHWSRDGFMDFLAAAGIKLRKHRDWISDHYRTLDAKTVEHHFEHRGSQAEIDWLVDNAVSIAIWTNTPNGPRNGSDWKSRTGWKIDTDGLGGIGFAKCIDPYTAFQELSMWVGGVLPRPGNPMVEISSEKVMVAKHGMDEWSFRTPPGPKR